MGRVQCRALLLALALAVVVRAAHARVVSVRDMGAVGDGVSDDTAAIRKAFAACPPAACRVVFPAGRYVTAPFNVTSNTVVQVDGTVLGSTVYGDYPLVKPFPSYCQGREHDGPRYHSLVSGYDVHNVTFTGSGVVDGQGLVWWVDHYRKKLRYTRPRLLEMVGARDVRVEGLTFRNSAFWTLHFIYCDGVVVDGVRVANPLGSPHTDGIDPDSSRNVWIKNSVVSAGDDNIAIKSGMDYCGRQYGKPAENILIENCTFPHGNGIAIGSEMSGGVRNVTVRDCSITDTWFGHIYIKSARGRGGVVENITFDNITAKRGMRGVYIMMNYKKGRPPTNSTATPVFRNIAISNVHSEDDAMAGEITCLPESPCTGLSLHNVHVKSVLGWQECKDVHDGVVDDVVPSLACVETLGARGE